MTFAGKSFAAALMLAAPLTAMPAAAQESQPTPRIVVTGEGSASIAPDMAVLSLTVMRDGKTAREALDANSAAMKEVLGAMKAEGIEDRDLQTENFSIEPQYYYPQRQNNGEAEQPRITGYLVRNSLTVRLRELDKLGGVLDKAVTLGVNQGGNITFTNDDPSATVEKARTEAVKNAAAKAKTLAKAAGVSLGKVLEISEMSTPSMPEPYAKVRSAMVESADAVPVAAGENAYTVTVNVTFALDQ